MTTSVVDRSATVASSEPEELGTSLSAGAVILRDHFAGRTVAGLDASAVLFVLATSLSGSDARSTPMGTTAASGEVLIEEVYHVSFPRVDRGLSEDDQVLESPNWLATRIGQLAHRSYTRVNDPRRPPAI